MWRPTFPTNFVNMLLHRPTNNIFFEKKILDSVTDPDQSQNLTECFFIWRHTFPKNYEHSLTTFWVNHLMYKTALSLNLSYVKVEKLMLESRSGSVPNLIDWFKSVNNFLIHHADRHTHTHTHTHTQTGVITLPQGLSHYLRNFVGGGNKMWPWTIRSLQRNAKIHSAIKLWRVMGSNKQTGPSQFCACSCSMFW